MIDKNNTNVFSNLAACESDLCKKEFEQSQNIKRSNIRNKIISRQDRIQEKELNYQFHQAIKNGNNQNAEKIWSELSPLRKKINTIEDDYFEKQISIINFKKCKVQKCGDAIKSMIKQVYEDTSKVLEKQEKTTRWNGNDDGVLLVRRKKMDKIMQEFRSLINDIYKDNNSNQGVTIEQYDTFTKLDKAITMTILGEDDNVASVIKRAAMKLKKAEKNNANVNNLLSNDEKIKNSNSGSLLLDKFNFALRIFDAENAMLSCILKYDDCRRLKFENDVDAPYLITSFQDEIERIKNLNVNTKTKQRKMIMLSMEAEKKWIMCFLSKNSCVQRYGSIIQAVVDLITTFLSKNVSIQDSQKFQLEEMRDALMKLRKNIVTTESLSDRFKFYQESKLIFANLIELSSSISSNVRSS